MWPDGICRTTDNHYTKTVQYQDINYQLNQNEDKTAIFEGWCDFLNYFDSSVDFQLSFLNLTAAADSSRRTISIPLQGDEFDSIRAEYTDMLQGQLSRGNNGIIKTKFLTFGINARNIKEAKPRLERIELDILANFKKLGVKAAPLTGKDRLRVMHSIFRMGTALPFNFDWRWLVPTGLSPKDFIAPSAFEFRTGNHFRMGDVYGQASFLQIDAPELNDRVLADFLDIESNILVMIVSPMGSGGILETVGYHSEFSDRGIEYFIERARGGFGLMFIGGDLVPDNAVDAHDPLTAMLNYPDYFRKQGLALNERASFYDMKLFQQLTMGLGRDDGFLAASETPQFMNPSEKCTALTTEQIKQKIDCVIRAAKLCQDSGFAGVEVHALHWGYLMDELATPFFNHRTDEYGGSLENRLRAAKEIIEGIKELCGKDYPVSIRVGLKSFIKGFNKPSLTGEGEVGRTLEESIEICKLLEQYGYDCLSVDVGTYDSFYHACPPQYMPFGHVIPLAAEVKKHVSIPVLCGSRMQDPYKSEQALAEGKIDAVVMGRATLADPHYAKKIEMGTPEKIRPCIGCIVGCMGKVMNAEAITCAVNPACRNELNYGIKKTLNPRKVAVIGGGVSGMEAARTLKLRGFDVTIYERSGKLGGNLIPAGAHKFKVELHQLIEWYKREIADLGIPVVYHANMTAESVMALHPDVAILSVGSDPIMPRIPGIDHVKSISAVKALEGHIDLGHKLVVVGGGLVGCEFAIDKAMEGHEVTLIEAGEAVLAASDQIAIMIRQMIPDLLEHHKVNVVCNHKIVEINDNGAVICPTAGGENIELEADQVVMAIGMKPRKTFVEELKGSGIEVFTIGDCNKQGMVYSSVHSAYEVARML